MTRYAAGQVFGKLTLLRRGPSTPRNAVWVCLCECGKTSSALAFCLGNGNTRSCGCGIAHRDRMPAFLERANSPEEWARYKRIFEGRKLAGFPGSEVL